MSSPARSLLSVALSDAESLRTRCRGVLYSDTWCKGQPQVRICPRFAVCLCPRANGVFPFAHSRFLASHRYNIHVSSFVLPSILSYMIIEWSSIPYICNSLFCLIFFMSACATRASDTIISVSNLTFPIFQTSFFDFNFSATKRAGSQYNIWLNIHSLSPSFYPFLKTLSAFVTKVYFYFIRMWVTIFCNYIMKWISYIYFIFFIKLTAAVTLFCIHRLHLRPFLHRTQHNILLYSLQNIHILNSNNLFHLCLCLWV